MSRLNINDQAYLLEVNEAGPTRDGLVLHLDAGDSRSYFGGILWNDISGRGRNINVLPTAFNNTGPKYMDFNGSYGCAKFQTSDFIPNSAGIVTAVVWSRIKTSTAEWRTLFRALSTGSPHQVIIESGAYGIGMYSSGYRGTGYQQTSIPGWNTSRWNMFIWRWPAASPYYQFGYNDTPSLASSTDANATFSNGICSIGAYNNENQNDCSNAAQYWGDIASVRIYNRYLSNGELLNIWNATKGRFAL